jgi:hypothetical protein
MGPLRGKGSEGSIGLIGHPKTPAEEESRMKEELEFYDIKKKVKFKTMTWRIEIKVAGNRTRYFAVAPVPGEGREAWRIVSKDFADKNKAM